jgi:hypothetical protein
MGKSFYRIVIVLTIVVTFISGIFGEDNKKEPPKINKVRVEAAIKKGLDFLLESIKKNAPLIPALSPPNQEKITAEEFVLYTLIKGGADTNNDIFNALLEKVLAKKLERTYPVSVLVMALAELDSQKYMAQISECGQFLIDNQCKNGQWDYGLPVEPLNVKITPSTNDKDKEDKTKAVKTIQLRKRKEGRSNGDNSNTQYACLGLRACMQSGVIIPSNVFALTVQWLEKNQEKDGGWGYGSPNGVQPPANGAYGSMTVGALGSLIICKFYLIKKIPETDPKVRQGIDWLIKNYTVTENPKFSPAPPNSSKMWDYYYLYALERLGAFLEKDEFGKNYWYPEGATYLIEQQRPNGSWRETIDTTCFAILFLRRATKPLRIKITGNKE